MTEQQLREDINHLASLLQSDAATPHRNRENRESFMRQVMQAVQEYVKGQDRVKEFINEVIGEEEDISGTTPATVKRKQLRARNMLRQEQRRKAGL